MAVADRFTGKNMYITLNGVVISADFQSVKVSRDAGKAEKTAGADTHASYIPTYLDTTVEVEVLKKSGAAGTSEWGLLVGQLGAGTDGTLVWIPEGNNLGKSTSTAIGFIESLETEFPFDDMVKLTVGFQCNAVTNGVVGV